MKQNNGKGCKNNKSRCSKKPTKRDLDKKDSSRYSDAPNDPIWYGETPALIRDSASLSYGYPTGREIKVSNYSLAGMYNTVPLPGVMAFKIHPAVGIATNDNDVVNIAARNVYSWVRHANSGHTNYDAPDLMLYLLAMDSLYSMYSWGCRIYGLVRMYSHVNRYWPLGILEAEYVDGLSFVNNIANFRYFLDVMAKKIGSLCVPNSMPYFKRHTMLYSNVYLDAPVVKGQMYLYTPGSFWIYDELSGAGYLRPSYTATVSTSPFTEQQFESLANAMIDAVMGSEDMNIMSGDILKAFGESNIVKLNLVPIEYQTPILYSPEILAQIQNLTMTGCTATSVTQNANVSGLLCSVGGTTPHTHDDLKIITMAKEDVQPEETMVATRLTAFITSDSSSSYHLDTVGSEYVEKAIVMYYDSTNQPVYAELGVLGITLDLTNATPDQSLAKLSTLTAIEKFNQHPLVHVCDQNTAGLKVGPRLQDIDNWTLISLEELREMNEAALLSQFNVPQMGLWATKTT